MPFCGVWIWGTFLLVLIALLSVVPGSVVYLLARKKKSPGKEVAAALAVVVAFFLMIGGCLASYQRCANDFACDRGFADYFRIPLQYPYQISSFDGLGDGCLATWQEEGSCILSGITQYAVKSPIMVGRIGPSWDAPDRPERWFSFNFDTGEIRRYNSKEAFVAASQALGFEGEPAMRSIREHYYGW